MPEEVSMSRFKCHSVSVTGTSKHIHEDEVQKTKFFQIDAKFVPVKLAYFFMGGGKYGFLFVNNILRQNKTKIKQRQRQQRQRQNKTKTKLMWCFYWANDNDVYADCKEDGCIYDKLSLPNESTFDNNIDDFSL